MSIENAQARKNSSNYCRLVFHKDFECEGINPAKAGDTFMLVNYSIEHAKRNFGGSPWREHLEYQEATRSEFEAWFQMRESRHMKYVDKVIEKLEKGEEMPMDFWVEFGMTQGLVSMSPEQANPSDVYEVEQIIAWMKRNKKQEYREVPCDLCKALVPWIELTPQYSRDDWAESPDACRACYFKTHGVYPPDL